MTYLEILQAQLEVDEGRRNKIYPDSKGIPTIGIGHNLHKPISDRAIQIIFEDDMADAEADARKLIPVFDQLTDARKAVVVNMAFNLGYFGFGGFHQTIFLICAGNYEGAADAMLNSTWAKQVGNRAQRLADVMRHG